MKTTFEHLMANKDVLGGKMCIKGTRISVETVLEWLSNGATTQDILVAYPQIVPVALSEVLKYAALSVGNEVWLDINTAA
jgi:uncharacterized protein (DUF433 family)